jgi:hypothetical protein
MLLGSLQYAVALASRHFELRICSSSTERPWIKPSFSDISSTGTGLRAVVVIVEGTRDGGLRCVDMR